MTAENVYNDIRATVGNTPLIKLRKASEETGCTIYGKAEFLNPGCSIKARAALSLIEDAESRGLLIRGEPGTIIEATSGSLGVCLAQVAKCFGYQCIIIMADSRSQEKMSLIRQSGAKLITIPLANPYNPNHVLKYAQRLLNSFPKDKHVVFLNQLENIANRQAHYKTTGPEIYNQLSGKIHGFSCSAGSGATIAGIAKYLRSVDENIQIALTDSKKSSLVNYYKYGELKPGGDSVIDGIGVWKVTKNLIGFKPDFAYYIPDEDAFKTLCEVMEEGLDVGPTSGLNIAGAIRFAKELGPGHTIVTVLCDLGSMHSQCIFNKDFLNEKNLPTPKFLDNNDFPDDLREAMSKALIPEDIAKAEEEANRKANKLVI